MNWESLVSIQNLKLAWRRINTGKNLHHKHFFREFYLVYETALDDNLRALRQRLLAKAWEPTHPNRIYLPKPSGLQRPITLLSIEDQILLQAVANIFAKKLTKKRKPLELEKVFSNILTEGSNSIFFLESWYKTYNAFQENCTNLYNSGNPWIAHFDLAAFYDTISHDMLVRIVSPSNAHTETWDIVRKWLHVWSAPKANAMTSHGIPQGPIASDFLAEAFFLPIDIELKRKKIKFIRYVDDIRLFGTSENEARSAAITLEWLCRDRGLIPQGKKFAISYAKSPEEALGSLPSLPPENHENEPNQMTSEEASDLLESCIEGRPMRVIDKSRFRYVMYRAPKNSKILGKILRLLPRYPEHLDAISAYFGRYKKSKRIATALITMLREGVPYAYVRGEFWHLLARLSSPVQYIEALDMAKEDARIRSSSVSLSWGVMNFLLTCQEKGLCSIGKRLKGELSLSRALLSNKIPHSEFQPKRVIPIMLKGTIEEQLAAARQVQIRSCSLASLGLRQANLPETCRHSLRSLGVIRRASKTPRDWIAERLTNRYGSRFARIWRKLLGVEYEHALQLLIEADAMYDVSPSNWLQLQNSFNDAVTRQFIAYLHLKGNKGGSQKTVSANGKLVKYGSLIQKNGPLSKAFPKLCADLLTVNERRNKLPGSHPYDEKGGSQNSWLKSKSRDSLVVYVCNPLLEIANWVDKNS